MANIFKEFLDEFDGVRSNTIFCLWAGLNAMSLQRIQALWSVYNNSHCQVAFINAKTIRDWEKPDYPFHRAFDFLSETHKSDYLRCYLMHHYGGGWTDIKHTMADWRPFFERLRTSKRLALGYQEIPDGIPHITSALGDEIRANYQCVIGLCAFIFKKQSKLTQTWLNGLHKTLDAYFYELKESPAQHPQDQKNMRLPDGTTSKYPLSWAEILGEIFHPLMFSNKDLVLQDDIRPLLFGYR